MSNWKNQPHLFANGNFKFGIEDKYINLSLEMYFPQTDQLAFNSIVNRVDIENCQLIARPTSDMTDDEVKDYPNYGIVKKVDWWKGQIEHRIRNKSLSAKELLYLLSISVYPFDDEEGVIFKPRH